MEIHEIHSHNYNHFGSLWKMRGHFAAPCFRVLVHGLLLLVIVIKLVHVTNSCCAQGLLDESLPASWQSEASLHDVCFIDSNNGWAVGDHGTILRTADGGTTWKTIAELNQTIVNFNASNRGLSLSEKLRGVSNRKITQSPTARSRDPSFTCQLSGIFFLDQKNGWACGGYPIPFLDRTQSVVLRTNDGGMTWHHLSNTSAPALKQIHFSSLRSGWAVGEAGHKFRAGIYYTHDGGNTWSSDAPEVAQKSLSRAAKYQNNTISVSSSGAVLFTKADARNPSEMNNAAILDKQRRHFNDAAFDHQGNVWAVGTAGAIFKSIDRGLSFRPVELNFKQELDQDQTLPLIDFETLALTENKIWAAGQPGSCLVSIDRNTGQINFHKTPITTSINRITFIDDQTGWAVGDFGVILATTDQGRTWEVQRGKNRRLDLLTLCATPRDIPLNLLADLACENNLLCGTLLTGHGKSEASMNAELGITTLHAQTAASRCGNAVWRLVDSTGQTDGAQLKTYWLRSLVKSIRQHRPSCIVLKAGMTEAAVTQAIYMAADRRVLNTDHTKLNLPAWQVKRMMVADLGGSASISRDKLLPLEGKNVADRTMVSRALLNVNLVQDRPTRWRILRFIGRGAGGQATTAVPSQESSLLRAIGQIAGRSAKSRSSSGIAIINHDNQKRQMFDRLMNTDIHDETSMRVWQNDLLSLTLTTDRHQAGDWVMELADKYFSAGRPELASRTLQVLSTRFPEHTYAPAAQLWLATYFASNEFNLRAFFAAKAAAETKAKTAAQDQANLRQNIASNATTANTQTQTELSKIQAIDIGNGDQRLSWEASNPGELKKQIAQVQQQRQRMRDSTTGDSDLDELIRLAGEVDQQIDNPQTAQTAETAQTPAETKENTQPTAGQHNADRTQQVESQFELKSWLKQRRQLATKFLNRLNNQDRDLAESPTCQKLAIRLTMNATQPAERAEKLQQRFRQTNDRAVQQWIGEELAIIKARTNASDSITDLFDGPSSQIRCLSATARPQLDGLPEDIVWHNVYRNNALHRIEREINSEAKTVATSNPHPDPNIKLVSFDTPAVDRSSDTLMFAHDDQFLYLLATISKLPEEKYRTSDRTRARDSDLNGRDRIEIELDIDRDGHTRFLMAIDYRGWATESINGMNAWDPTWFIHRKETNKNWTIEAAIPLRSLLGQTNTEPQPNFQIDRQTIDAIGEPVCWSIGLRRRRWENEEFWHHSTTARNRPSLFDLIRPSALPTNLLIFE